MKKTISAIVFFTAGIGCIVFESYDLFMLSLISKALIIPALIIFFLLSVNKPIDNISKHITAGLIFSWIGDVLLQLTRYNDKMFIFGLASFLITQVIYAEVFFIYPGSIKKTWLFLISLALVLYGVLLVTYLFPSLGIYKIPVIIYATAIISMNAGAFSRFGKVNNLSYTLIATGAVLFLISDSFIAVNKFKTEIHFARIWIMSTYIIAQFLIIMGSIVSQGKKKG